MTKEIDLEALNRTLFYYSKLPCSILGKSDDIRRKCSSSIVCYLKRYKGIIYACIVESPMK